jgi:hypothetical protein
MKKTNVKLRSTNKSHWGKTVILPSLGEVEISEEGVLEVEGTLANMLVEKTSNYEFLKNDSESEQEETTEVEETEVETNEMEESVEEENEAEESVEEKDSIDFESLSLAELISVAEDAGLDIESYKKFIKNKKLMISFLKQNINP